MRKVLTALTALMMLALVPATAPATHEFAGNGCASGNPDKLTENPDVRVDQVDDGEIDKYEVKLEAGERAIVLAQWINGDADVYVCKKGGGSNHPCGSPNMYPIGDGCLYEELLDHNDPVFDIRIMDWGNRLEGPGTFIIHVQACWSSKDQPDGAAQGVCDYSQLFGGGILPEGSLDPLPPIQYVLAMYKDSQLP